MRDVTLSPLEISEGLAADLAEALHERTDSDVTYDAVFDVVTRRMARSHRHIDDWTTSSGADIDAAEELVERVESERPDRERCDGYEEPHLLGWFHQFYGEPKRDESNRAHNEKEAKHASQSVTTQLYTPRWIADLLVTRTVELAGDDATILDPAVGGGQFLLAAYDVLARRQPDSSPQEIVGRLRGVDIDARAVEAARRGLKLHVARSAGQRSAAAEELIDQRVVVGDGLFDEVAPADVVLTNPPYMGSRSMGAELKKRIRARYQPYHGDLYAAFIDRCHQLADECVGILAQQTIWYLKRFRRARLDLLERGALDLFVHLGPHAFASLSGEKANVVAFVQRAESEGSDEETRFIDLRDLTSPSEMRTALQKELGASSDRSETMDIQKLAVIPGRPVSHWLPSSLRRHFASGRCLGDIADIPGCQNKTGANRNYVFSWREVPREELHLRPMVVEPPVGSDRARLEGDLRWVFYSKGGRFAPWWGNWHSVVDWSPEARKFYDENSTSNLLPRRYRFRQGICYTDFGGSSFNARWMPPGCLFDMAGPAIFPDTSNCSDPSRRLFALLGLLNTDPVRRLLNALNPSIHYQVTDLRRLPLPDWSEDDEQRLANLALAQVRDLRRVAATVGSSPVPESVAPDGLDRHSFTARISERNDELHRLAWTLYGSPITELSPPRSKHRYL